MKKVALALSSVAVIMLAGCVQSGVSTYRLHFINPDEPRKTEIVKSVQNVIERRIKAMGGTTSNFTVQTATGSEPIIRFTASDPKQATELQTELTAPFTFRLMRQTETGETPDTSVEGFGGFTETGLEEKDVAWVVSATDPTTYKSLVNIQFTPDGQEKLKSILSQYKGKRMGLFVRGRLISTLSDSGDVKGGITINGIPSQDIAAIFTDDVNVGTHIQFVPIK